MNFHQKPTTFVGHVKLKVEDLNRSLSFYQDIIGFDILEQTESTAKLTADGKTSILSIVQPEGVLPKEPRTTGMYHFALLLPEREDLANIILHLHKHSIQMGAADHLVSEAIYLSDPDGNEIEIYVDRDPSVWSWSNDEVAMTTDPLDIEGILQTRTNDNGWDRLPQGTIMGHIHLHVAELNKTEEFYVKGLGFDVVNRFGKQALFLSAEKYHHHIGLNTWKGEGAPKPTENSVGMESVMFVYADEATRKQTIENIEKIGGSVTVEDGRILTYDPSGIRIELAI